jgi:hypothetical protein
MSQRAAGKRLARRRSRCDWVPGKREYRYIDATYRSRFTEPSPNNGSAVDTEGDGVTDSIQVRPGSRIPRIPRHMFLSIVLRRAKIVRAVAT